MAHQRRILPSFLLVLLQLLAIAAMATTGFWLLSAISTSGASNWVLRIGACIFLLFNCVVVRFMKSSVLAWSGMGMNLLTIALFVVLILKSKNEDPTQTTYYYRPSEAGMLYILTGIMAASVVFQFLFKLIYRRGDKVFTLCSGGIDSVRIDEHDYVEIDGELIELHDVGQKPLVHTGCGPGIVPAWLMRITAFTLIPLALLVFMLGAGIMIATSESKDPVYIKARGSMAYLYFENAAVLLIWSIFANFISFRFSSRRRLLLFILCSLSYIIYTIAIYGLVMKIASTLSNPGALLSGFLLVPGGACLAWTGFAIWALTYRRLFDHSCCLCLRAKFKDLGHCVVA